MKKEIAVQVNKMLIAQYVQLNESIYLVRDNCTEEEFIDYRRAAGAIMTDMYFKIMKAIHLEYPELEPEELRKLKMDTPYT